MGVWAHLKCYELQQQHLNHPNNGNSFHPLLLCLWLELKLDVDHKSSTLIAINRSRFSLAWPQRAGEKCNYN
ncbi:hypothetical protein ACLKA6_014603 [Drosophila palustris]